MAEQSPRVPFDDRPALEELERLQRSIQEYRRKREQAEGEFEQFVGGFRPAPGESAGTRTPLAASAAAPVVAGVATGPEAHRLGQMPLGAPAAAAGSTPPAA